MPSRPWQVQPTIGDGGCSCATYLGVLPAAVLDFVMLGGAASRPGQRVSKKGKLLSKTASSSPSSRTACLHSRLWTSTAGGAAGTCRSEMKASLVPWFSSQHTLLSCRCMPGTCAIRRRRSKA
ncbi:hypothetical protein OH492_10010 [Vibrio chagasii]|nr:hypothetical protein [Vibrio chagasii]